MTSKVAVSVPLAFTIVFSMKKSFIHRSRNAQLGLAELIAIALGGMIGGGIFTILGVSVDLIGAYTPVAIFLGGLLALLTAYSYCKLGVYYKDEGATYSFVKRVFRQSRFAASLVGWWVSFGYVSTIALYAYTFSSYAVNALGFESVEWLRKLGAAAVILLFALINVWSVRGMGKVEDLMVYTKLVLLVLISFVLLNHSTTSLPILFSEHSDSVSLLSILVVASITFVAYEGFQLVIAAVNEIDDPERNIPRAIYSAIGLAILVYVIIALGALLSIPLDSIVKNQENALAAGAEGILGRWGGDLVVIGALLATSSAISGTLFGASRLMAVIAADGHFPAFLAKRRQHIPVSAILCMSVLAFCLILVGGLRLILEFGSITFLLVSCLMAYANHKVRDLTNSSPYITLTALVSLLIATLLIIYYEYSFHPEQLFFIVLVYLVLTAASWFYSINSQNHA